MGCCSVCGDYEEMDYTCNYCGKIHCVTHRLPESHDCSALNNFGQISKHLQSDTDAKLKGKYEEDKQSEAQSKPDKSSPGTDSERSTASNTNAREEHGPKPIERVQTHGGSGRDRENADFPRSPDVNPDGSLADSEIEPIERNYPSDETESGIWNRLNEYIWTYGLLAIILLILQFGLGVDVFSLLKKYLPGI